MNDNETTALEPTQVASVHIAPAPEMLIAQAIEKGLTVETIERLVSLKERMDASAAKRAFDEDMARFQSECPIIEKDTKVKFNTKSGASVDYAYAPIDSIVKQLKGLIAKHGFSYSFKLEEDSGAIRAICIVKHKLGHSESSDFTAERGGTALMSQAQITSGAATYAKRNAFCNVFGIVTGDEDNDAAKSRDEAKAEIMATQEQRNEIDRLAQLAGVTIADVVYRCRADYGVSYTEISQTQAMGIIDRLNLKIKKTVA